VIEMQFIEVPELRRLHGEKVVEALYGFVDEPKEQRGEEFTDKQTTALIKFASGLISSIEGEKQLVTSEKDIKEMALLNQLRKTIMRYIPRIFRTNAEGRLWKLSR